jgi:hypothetical protein
MPSLLHFGLVKTTIEFVLIKYLSHYPYRRLRRQLSTLLDNRFQLQYVSPPQSLITGSVVPGTIGKFVFSLAAELKFFLPSFQLILKKDQ